MCIRLDEYLKKVKLLFLEKYEYACAVTSIKSKADCNLECPVLNQIKFCNGNVVRLFIHLMLNRMNNWVQQLDTDDNQTKKTVGITSG